MNLFSNPWKVSNLEEFLYYCCPECIFRCKRIEEFEQHAIIAHLVEIHGQSDGNPPIIKLKNDLDEDPLKEENLNEVVKDEDKTVVKKEQFDEANDYHHSKSMVEVKIENDDEVFDENDYNYYEAEQSDYQYTLQYTQEYNKELSLKKDKDHKCESCGKLFSDVRNLKRHIRTIHENSEKNHKCELCGKAFSLAHHLKNHNEVIHENPGKNHKCETCGKSFSLAHHL